MSMQHGRNDTDGENRQHLEILHQGHSVWTLNCGVKGRQLDTEAGKCSGTAQNPCSGRYTLQLLVIPQPTPAHCEVRLYAWISLHVTTASFQILIPPPKKILVPCSFISLRIHSFRSLLYERSTVSSKASYPCSKI